VAGGTARAAAAATTCPITVVKTRMEMTGATAPYAVRRWHGRRCGAPHPDTPAGNHPILLLLPCRVVTRKAVLCAGHAAGAWEHRARRRRARPLPRPRPDSARQRRPGCRCLRQPQPRLHVRVSAPSRSCMNAVVGAEYTHQLHGSRCAVACALGTYAGGARALPVRRCDHVLCDNTGICTMALTRCNCHRPLSACPARCPAPCAVRGG